MINSLLYCMGDRSSLLFRDFCRGEIFDKREVGSSDRFFIDDLSFNVRVDDDFYLCSPVLSKNIKSTTLESNCNILNRLFDFNFQPIGARFFIRKEWLKKYGRKTIFKNFNVKRDYMFSGMAIKVPSKCEVSVGVNCNVVDYMVNMSRIFKSKYRVGMTSGDVRRKTLIIKYNDISILDPSTFILK